MINRKEELLYALDHDWSLLENTAGSFIDNPELVIYALDLNADFIFQYASDSIKNDMEIALAAVENRCGLAFIGKTIRYDPNFMIEVARRVYPYQLLCSLMNHKHFEDSNPKSFQSFYHSALNREIDIETSVNNFFKANTDLLVLQFGCNMEKVLKKNPQLLTTPIATIRDNIFIHYDINTPKIRIQTNPMMPTNAYQFMIQGVIVNTGTINQGIPDSIVTITDAIQELILKNIETIIQYQEISKSRLAQRTSIVKYIKTYIRRLDIVG